MVAGDGGMMRKLVGIGITVCAFMVLIGSLARAETRSPMLTNEDCTKCHLEQARDVDTRGGLHNSEVGCLDCHEEHAPSGKNTITLCSSCHDPSEQDHYRVENCIRCHYPHYPMEMDLTRIESVRSACVSCHPQPDRDMKTYASAHAEMDCNQCHAAHAEATACGECHEPHADGMADGDCLKCHRPHRPTAIDFTGDVESGLCRSCHEDVVEMVNDRGEAHTQVGCVECHRQHPPEETDVIPECAACHGPDDSAHYQVGGCETCHPPHEPLNMDYSGMSSVKPVCVSCHEPPGREMQDYPGSHSEMDCRECHAAHAESSACLDCHEPHAAKMETADCFTCHQPHRPTDITYAERVPTSFCTVCHERAGRELAGTKTAHRVLACTYCHQKKHKHIIECRTCHGEPHSSDIHAKYPDCRRCHQGPHALTK